MKKVLAALEGNWQAEMEGYHTYLRWPIATPTRCARRCCATWRPPSWSTPPSGPAASANWAAPSPSTAAIPAARPTRWPTAPAAFAWPCVASRSRRAATSPATAEQLKALGDEGSVAILEHVIEDEKEHYRELGSLLRGHYTAPAGAPKVDPKAVLDEMLAKRNQGRKQPGAWIGDAIYGVNDGLGAIFGIVSGVSGATAGDSKYVLLAGLSGMIASALSMGSGAYLAAKSEREIYQAEIAREREAIQMNRPRGARTALALLPGQGPARARRPAHGQPHRQRPRAAAARARARAAGHVGRSAVQSDGLGQLRRAVHRRRRRSFRSFRFSSCTESPPSIAAAIVSLAAHFAVGAAKSLITVRSWWSSGLEMTVVGAVEGAVTYGIGILLGKGGM